MLVALALSAALADEPEVLRWRPEIGHTARYHVVAEVGTEARRGGRTLIERRERYEYAITERVEAVEGGVATRRWTLDEVRGLYVDPASGHDFTFSAAQVPEDGLAADVAGAVLGLVGSASTYRVDEVGAVEAGEAAVLDLFGSGHSALWEVPLPAGPVGEGSAWQAEVAGVPTAFVAGEVVESGGARCRVLTWSRSREVLGGTTTEEGSLCFSASLGRPLWSRSTSMGRVEPLPGLVTEATLALAVTTLTGEEVPWTLEATAPWEPPVLRARVLGEERWMAPGRIQALCRVGDGFAAAARGRVVRWDPRGVPLWVSAGEPGEVAGLAATEDALVVATRRERLHPPRLEAWRLSDGAPAWERGLPVQPTSLAGHGGVVAVGGEDGGVGEYAAQGGLWPEVPALRGPVDAVVAGRGWRAALGDGRLAVHGGTHWQVVEERGVTAISSLGERLLVAAQGRITLRDPRTGAVAEEVGGLGEVAEWVEVHHVAGAGEAVAALDGQGRLHTWQRRRKGWRPARVVADVGVGPLAVDPDGTVWWVDWLGWHLRSTHSAHSRAASQPSLLTGLALSPATAQVATADVSGQVLTWDLESGQEVERTALPRGWDGAASLAWAEGAGLVYGGGLGGGLVGGVPAWGRAVDLAASGERVFVLGRASVSAWEHQGGGRWSQAWSAAGESCAVESGGPVVATQAGGQVQIRSALTGEMGTSLDGAARYACGLSLSASGQRVAAIAEPDHRAAVWDAVSGEVLLAVALPQEEAEDRFVSLALSPDGRWLAGGFAGRVALWSVDEPARGPGGSPSPSALLVDDGLVASELHFSADGRWLVALPHAGLALRTWDLATLLR